MQEAGLIEDIGSGFSPCWQLTGLGFSVAGQLRAHKAGGGSCGTFEGTIAERVLSLGGGPGLNTRAPFPVVTRVDILSDPNPSAALRGKMPTHILETKGETHSDAVKNMRDLIDNFPSLHWVKPWIARGRQAHEDRYQLSDKANKAVQMQLDADLGWPPKPHTE